MQNEKLGIEKTVPQETSDSTPPPRAGEGDKRKFVEPSVSGPVDVLEATTFFQDGVSGELLE